MYIVSLSFSLCACTRSISDRFVVCRWHENSLNWSFRQLDEFYLAQIYQTQQKTDLPWLRIEQHWPRELSCFSFYINLFCFVFSVLGLLLHCKLLWIWIYEYENGLCVARPSKPHLQLITCCCCCTWVQHGHSTGTKIYMMYICSLCKYR